MTLTSLLHNFNDNDFLQTVIKAVFFNFCFQSSLKTATDCYQTERQIQRDAWGSAHTRVAQQYGARELYANNGEGTLAN